MRRIAVLLSVVLASVVITNCGGGSSSGGSGNITLSQVIPTDMVISSMTAERILNGSNSVVKTIRPKTADSDYDTKKEELTALATGAAAACTFTVETPSSGMSFANC